MSFDSSAVEVFVDTDDYFLAAYGSLLLQVRRGPLTLSLLDRVESIVLSVRARQGGGAFIGVLEDTAEVASGPVRERQTVLFKELLKHERSWAVTLIPGTGARSALLRTTMRIIAFSNPRLAIVNRSADAGQWLEGRLKVPAREVAAYIDWCRARPPPKIAIS